MLATRPSAVLVATCALTAVLGLVPAAAHAAAIASTAAGGPWAAPGTWEGGVVPGADDQVTIAGPVTVAGTAACGELLVTAAGSLRGATQPLSRLEVTGAVTNHGTISDGPYPFFELAIGGDLTSTGAWTCKQVVFTGIDDRALSLPGGATLTTTLAMAPGAAGDVTATTPLAVTGDVDLTGGRLVLAPGSHLTVTDGAVRGPIAAGGNELRIAGWSYLENCTIDDAVLVGEVEATFLVTFTTRLVVTGTLQNATFTGGGAATIAGDLVNLGTITRDQYSFPVRVSGDLDNQGVIAASHVSFIDAGEHRLRMSPDAVIDCPVFLPEFQATRLVAETPVTFGDDLGLGEDGVLELEPGCAVRFTGFGGLNVGTVLAAGNPVATEENAGLNDVTLDAAVIAEQVALHGTVRCTGGLTVAAGGTLTSWTWAGPEVTVEGLLRNQGAIADGAHPVTVIARGDVDNTGTLSAAALVLAAAGEQRLGIGPGVAAAAVVLRSGLDLTGGQWFRDGVALPGETATDLVLAGAGPDQLGTYQYAADGLDSRPIHLVPALDTTDVPLAAGAALAQNHPNPFNPATTISFALPRAGAAQLVVYDLAGREVERLLDGPVAAGAHQVAWQPRGLASGVYVYRLRAPGVDLARRCLLLK